MIEVRDLLFRAGEFTLGPINLVMEAGASHVIVGPTGSGKTLLLECMIGFKSPASGGVLISSNEVTGLSPHLRHISYVPQDICLFPNMSVRANIEYARRMRPGACNGGGGDDGKSHLAELIDFFKIAPLLERYPANLSGGERQRVALVRALAPKPSLLILDEPFSAIDQSMREEARRMIKDMHKKLGVTLLMVTHDFEEAYFIGDLISVMMKGKIIQSGTAFDTYNYPKNRELTLFLGVSNIFAGRALEVAEKSVMVSWPEGGGAVKINCGCAGSKFTAGQLIEWGIRSEAVHILRDAAAAAEKINSFDASVKTIYSRGKTHTIVTETASGALVEIDVHGSAARRLNIFSLEKLRFSMNPDSIFIIGTNGERLD